MRCLIVMTTKAFPQVTLLLDLPGAYYTLCCCHIMLAIYIYTYVHFS